MRMGHVHKMVAGRGVFELRPLEIEKMKGKENCLSFFYFCAIMTEKRREDML